MTPGDRPERWKSTCNIQGTIMVFIGALFVTGGPVGILLGLGAWYIAYLDFRDARCGWKMTDNRPPWADRFDARDRKLDEELARIEKEKGAE